MGLLRELVRHQLVMAVARHRRRGTVRWLGTVVGEAGDRGVLGVAILLAAVERCIVAARLFIVGTDRR